MNNNRTDSGAYKLSRDARKSVFLVSDPTRDCTIRKLSEIKSADKLFSYCTTDLRLCFLRFQFIECITFILFIAVRMVSGSVDGIDAFWLKT